MRSERGSFQGWIRGPSAHRLGLGRGIGVAAPVGERGPRMKSVNIAVFHTHVRIFLRDETGSPKVFLRNKHLLLGFP